MNAWHKALEKVQRVVEARVYIDCINGDPRHGGRCNGFHWEDESLRCPTKMEAIKNAKKKGWTYDKEGNWLCPACSKGVTNELG